MSECHFVAQAVKIQDTCVEIAGQQKIYATRILKRTVKDNILEEEDHRDWPDTQVMHSEGNCGKSNSCLPDQLFSLNTLLLQEKL
jgi:hypothetical protein